MTNKTIELIISCLADNLGGEVFKGYSGRMMFGKQCWAISTDTWVSDINITGTLSDVVASEIDCVDVQAWIKAHGLDTLRFDSLGLGVVWYWPKCLYVE